MDYFPYIFHCIPLPLPLHAHYDRAIIIIYENVVFFALFPNEAQLFPRFNQKM